MILTIVVAVVVAVAVHVINFRRERARNEAHAAKLNEWFPDGPPGFVHDHGEVQSFTGPGCGWCCHVIYCWFIPCGTSCTYVCNGGGGGGGGNPH